jgi:uncharacterized membrane protein (DUF485 family)
LVLTVPRQTSSSTEVTLVNLLLFLLVLPAIIAFCNRAPSTHTRNRSISHIIRVSFTVLVMGCILLAVFYHIRPTSRLYVPAQKNDLGTEAVVANLTYPSARILRVRFRRKVHTAVAGDVVVRHTAVRARVYSAILLVELFGMLTWEPLLQSLLALLF